MTAPKPIDHDCDGPKSEEFWHRDAEAIAHFTKWEMLAVFALIAVILTALVLGVAGMISGVGSVVSEWSK